MITKIFITVAALLVVLFLTSMYLVFRSSDVPIPIEGPGPQVVATASRIEEPQVSMGTSEFYAEVMRQTALATKTYEESRGQPYRVDLTQADGGLRAVLNQVTFALPADQSLFWRLVHGEKGLILCGQYLKKSEAETLAVILRDAAKLAVAVEQTGPCGQDAFGVQLGGVAGVAANPPALPPLPTEVRPPPPVVPAAPASMGAVSSAEGTACAAANPALEERLMRLL